MTRKTKEAPRFSDSQSSTPVPWPGNPDWSAEDEDDSAPGTDRADQGSVSGTQPDAGRRTAPNTLDEAERRLRQPHEYFSAPDGQPFE